MADARLDWVRDHVRVDAHELVVETPRSTVIRCTNEAETVYFKADHILPPPEGAVVARIADARPGRVPHVVAVDADRGWSLSRDAGPTGFDGATTDDWCHVARAFADVQRNSGASADAWLDLGCRDLRGRRLFDAITAMIDAESGGLTDAEVARLATKRDRFEEACAALAEDAVPAMLVHQDLVPVNIILGTEGPVFIDWSDTVVGHPFFGFDRLLDFCWTETDRKSAAIAAYLAGFAGIDDPARLRASFDRVLSLRVLYECVRWHHELSAIDSGLKHAVLLRADLLVGLRAMAR